MSGDSEEKMTSVLYGGSLNYQGRNPLQGEIRGIRRELDEIRGLITDLNLRLDKADIAALPEEETVAFQVRVEGSIEELPGKSNLSEHVPFATPVTLVRFITPPLLSHRAFELTVQIVGVKELTVRS